MEAIVSEDEKGVLQSTRRAVRALDSGSDTVQLLPSASQKAKTNNFQVLPCSESKESDVSIKLGAFPKNTQKE